MIAWTRNETFCRYIQQRRRRRAAMLEALYRNAANEHSRQLVDRLAQRWQRGRG